MEYENIFGAWMGDSAAGCANFGRYHQNPRHMFRAVSKSRVLFRLVCTSRKSQPPSLNVSVFACNERGQIDVSFFVVERSVATSNEGVYTNPSCGVATGHFNVDVGWCYCVVPSMFEPLNGEYKIILYSTSKLNILR